MIKWFLAVGALAVVLGVLLWQLAAPPKTPNPIAARASDESLAMPASATQSADNKQPTAVRPRLNEAPSKPDEAEPKPELLVPGSDDFGDRLDIIIPNKYRDVASDCYEGGLDPDLKLKLLFQLHIKNNEVFATDIKILKSEVPKELEECMISAVRESRWHFDDLPDWSEEHELFIRLRALKKYKSRREFDEY